MAAAVEGPNLHSLLIRLDNSDGEKYDRSCCEIVESAAPEKVVIDLDTSEDGEAVRNDPSGCEIGRQINKRKRMGEGGKENGGGGVGSIEKEGGGVGFVEKEDEYVYKSKAEEYRMLSDLSEFPQLAAMLEFEARILKKKSRRRNRNKRKRKQRLKMKESQSSLTSTVDEVCKRAEVLDMKPVMMSENGMPQRLLVDAAEEEKQANTFKDAETTEAVKAGSDVRSVIVIDLDTSSSKGGKETTDLGSCRGLVETVPTVAIIRKEGKKIEAENDTMSAQGDEASKDADWRAAIEGLFIELMAEEVRKDDMKSSAFEMSTWNFVEDELHNKTNEWYTQSQLKSKFNMLRMKFHEFTKMKDSTGFGWDSETPMCAAVEDVWDIYLRAHPSCKDFKKEVCDHYKLLVEMFNKSIASGILEGQLDEDFMSGGVHVDPPMGVSGDDANPPTYSLREGTQCRLASQPVDCCSGKESRTLKMDSTLEARTQASLEKVDKYVPAKVINDASAEKEYTVSQCMAVLEAMEGIHGDAYTKALVYFKDPEWRIMWMEMSDYRREQWLVSLT